MNLEIVTKEDLEMFRKQLLFDIKELLEVKKGDKNEWLRAYEVRKLLKISGGTLQNLRITGKLKPSKIGGVHLYSLEEIEKLLITNGK